MIRRVYHADTFLRQNTAARTPTHSPAGISSHPTHDVTPPLYSSSIDEYSAS